MNLTETWSKRDGKWQFSNRQHYFFSTTEKRTALVT